MNCQLFISNPQMLLRVTLDLEERGKSQCVHFWVLWAVISLVGIKFGSWKRSSQFICSIQGIMTGGVGKGVKGVQVECIPCRESRVTEMTDAPKPEQVTRYWSSVAVTIGLKGGIFPFGLSSQKFQCVVTCSGWHVARDDLKVRDAWREYCSPHLVRVRVRT